MMMTTPYNMSMILKFILSTLSRFPILPTTSFFTPIRRYQFASSVTLSQPILFHSLVKGFRSIQIIKKSHIFPWRLLNNDVAKGEYFNGEFHSYRFDNFISPGSYFIEFKDLPLNTTLDILIVDENKVDTIIQASELIFMHFIIAKTLKI